MSQLYCLEVTKAPKQEERFAICPRGEYSGDIASDVQFVPIGKAIFRSKNGQFVARHSHDLYKRIVDDMHARARAGAPEQWLLSARVAEYLPSRHEFISVYNGQEQERKPAEPEVPNVMLAQDGTWRVVPSTGFSKGPREWGYALAHVDPSSNVAYADRINGATKLETVTKLFQNPIPWIQSFVKTFPLAAPSDIPTPPEPVVERVYSQAELDAVPALDPKEWAVMPVEQHKRRFVFEPLYREAYRKMSALEDVARQKLAQQQAQENEEQELAKLRKEFLSRDEADARKSGNR